MPSPEVEFARSLARRAQQDLEALVVLRAHAIIADAVIGFHAQQAVEKALKAMIVATGGELRRTHDLQFLIDQARDRGVHLDEALAGSAWLTPWAVELRYDEDLDATIDRDRAVGAAVAAGQLVDHLLV